MYTLVANWSGDHSSYSHIDVGRTQVSSPISLSKVITGDQIFENHLHTCEILNTSTSQQVFLDLDISLPSHSIIKCLASYIII